MRTHKGFTLLEILIVLALTGIIAAFTAPIGIEFYRNQVLREATEDVKTVLQRAQRDAVYQRNDSAYGVAFPPTAPSGRYVLFQGNSYASRVISADRSYSFPPGISLSASGATEIMFGKKTGASADNTLTISLWNLGPNYQNVLHINTIGAISVE